MRQKQAAKSLPQECRRNITMPNSFVGVFSAKTTANGKSYLGGVPLDRLMPLLGTKGMVYFMSDKEKLEASTLPR